VSFDLTQVINNALGSSPADLTRQPGVSQATTPEMVLNASTDISKTLDSQDLFFRFVQLNQMDFNKSYGYELWIRDVVTDNTIAKYVFPINPQNISIQNPSANVLEATMKGIYETHNGSPFRPIVISGTTGTAPTLNTQSNATANVPGDIVRSLEYAFKNTISAVNGVVNQAAKTVSAFTGATQQFTGPLNFTNDNIVNMLTGYQSINDLDRFLDFYQAGKKQALNKGWRLYFIMNKDKKYYACSLGNWTINKAAGTVEYQYTINLTAYRREPTLPGLSPGSNNLKSKINASATSNTLSNIINGINQARTLVAQSNNVMSGIRNDINDSFTAPIGQIVLLGKDLVGLATNMYDFAFSGSTLSAMKADFNSYFTANKNSPAMQQVAATIAQIGTVGLVGGVTAGGKPISAMNTSAQAQLNSGLADQFQYSGDSSDPLNVLFANPANYPQVFSNFPIEDMGLSNAITNQLNSITQTTLQFKAKDLINMRNSIQDYATSISTALGGGSATYNAIKGLPPPPVNYKKLTVTDIILLNNINDILTQIDSFIAMMDLNEANNVQDYYQFYSDYAITQGLRFDNNNISRFFVPFPMDGSLEQLATQYLGAPERWIEIAALNALKQPYVDEVGYQIPIIGSPGGNSLIIADRMQLYIGQIVYVQSPTVTDTQQKIISIDVVSNTQTIVTFAASNTDLTTYQPTEGAFILAYAPDTVSPGMLIAIPSTTPPTFNTNFKTSPEIAELDGIAQMAKVDLLLDQTGDLVITGGGDVSLSYGYTNLLQAATIKIQTKVNSLLQLPSYGNPLDAGISTADISAQDVLNALNLAFKQDPRFGGLLAGEVQITGPAVVVSLLIKIADTNITLPVRAALPR